MQSACLALHCHLWSVWLYLVYTHNLINGTNVGGGGTFLKKFFAFFFSLKLMFETFLFIRRFQRDIIKNVQRFSCTVSDIRVRS